MPKDAFGTKAAMVYLRAILRSGTELGFYHGC